MPTQMTKPVPVAEHGRALGFIHLSWNLAMILSGLAGGVLFEAWNGLPLLIGGVAAAAGLPLWRSSREAGNPGGVSGSRRPDPAAREGA